MTKYNAKKTTIGNITFASRLEADRYEQLLWLERVGEISDLWLQVELQVNHGRIYPESGVKIKSTNYVADFMYTDKAQHKIIIEDTKGMETPEFRLKWNLAQSQYPEYEFRKVTRDMV